MSSGTTGGVRSSWWARRLAEHRSEVATRRARAGAPAPRVPRAGGRRTPPARSRAGRGSSRAGSRARWASTGTGSGRRARPTPESAMTRPRPCQTSGDAGESIPAQEKARRGPEQEAPPRTSRAAELTWDPGGPGRCGSSACIQVRFAARCRGDATAPDGICRRCRNPEPPRPPGGLRPLIPCSSRSSWESLGSLRPQVERSAVDKPRLRNQMGRAMAPVSRPVRGAGITRMSDEPARRPPPAPSSRRHQPRQPPGPTSTQSPTPL